MGSSIKSYISVALACVVLVFGITSWAAAQNNGRGNGNNGRGNPNEGAPQARNQRWVKVGTDMLYAFPTDTRVGIGLSNPAYPFEVVGDSRFHGQVGFDSELLLQGDLRFPNSIWTSDGFLGIGTTDPQYNLDLIGTSRFDGAVQFLQQVNFDGITKFNNTSSFNAEVYLPGSGTWNANGQVGIGTTNPRYMLEVAGTTLIQGKALFESEAEFTGAVTAADQLRVGGATHLSGAASMDSSLSVSGTSTFNGSGQFNSKVIFPQGIWTRQGQLGIGTSTPKSVLDVAGSFAVQGPAEFGNNGSFAGDVTVAKKLSVSGASHFSEADFDGIATFNGNVDMQKQLDVQGSAEFYQPVRFNSSVSVNQAFNVGGTADIGGDLSVTGTSLFTGNSQFEGQVGIGTMNPQASLDVAGQARFQQVVNFDQGGSFNGSLAVGQALDVAGTSIFSGNSGFASDVLVEGTAQFENDVRFADGVWTSDGRMVIGGTIPAEDYRLQVRGKMDAEELFLNGVPIKEAVAIWEEQNSGDIVFTEGSVGIVL